MSAPEDSFGPWGKIDCGLLELSVDGEGYTDDQVVTQVQYVGHQDESIVIAVIELNQPNQWDDQLVDEATALVSAAPDLLEELEQQADGSSTIASLLEGQNGPVAASLRGMLKIQEQSARAAIARAKGAPS